MTINLSQVTLDFDGCRLTSQTVSFRPTAGESLFLRKLVLGIPAQASGKNLTRPLMLSAPQPSCVRATSPHHRKLGAGYVALLK